MTPQARKLLEDMRDPAGDAASFTAGKSIDDYRASKILRRAVERSFEIVGEALTQLRKHDAALADRVGESRKIIAFRNILVHGYGAIDDGKTWDIVQNDLPVPPSRTRRAARVAGAGAASRHNRLPPAHPNLPDLRFP